MFNTLNNIVLTFFYIFIDIFYATSIWHLLWAQEKFAQIESVTQEM